MLLLDLMLFASCFLDNYEENKCWRPKKPNGAKTEWKSEEKVQKLLNRAESWHYLDTKAQEHDFWVNVVTRRLGVGFHDGQCRNANVFFENLIISKSSWAASLENSNRDMINSSKHEIREPKSEGFLYIEGKELDKSLRPFEISRCRPNLTEFNTEGHLRVLST